MVHKKVITFVGKINVVPLILCESVNKYTKISFYVHHLNINLDQCFKDVIMSNISDW